MAALVSGMFGFVCTNMLPSVTHSVLGITETFSEGPRPNIGAEPHLKRARRNSQSLFTGMLEETSGKTTPFLGWMRSAGLASFTETVH